MIELMDFYYGNYHLKMLGSFIRDKKNNLFYGIYTIENVKGYMVIVFRGKPSLDTIYATYTFDTVKGLNEYYMVVFKKKVTDTIFREYIQRMKNGMLSFFEDEFLLDLIDIERMKMPEHKDADDFKPDDFKDFEGRIFPIESYKEIAIYKGNDFNGTIDVSEFGDVLKIIIN